MKRLIIISIIALLSTSLIGQDFETFKKGKFMGLRKGEETVIVTPDKYNFIGNIVDKYTWVNVGGKKHCKSFPNGGKWGVIDSTGREVCPPVYDYVAACRNDFVVVNVGGSVIGSYVTGGKWGLYDLKSGKVAIEPSYTLLSAVNDDGRLWACMDGKMDFRILGDTIFGKKKKVEDFEPYFEYITLYPLNMTICHESKYGDWSLIDTENNTLTTNSYSTVFDFIDGYSLVYSKGRYGYIDRNGRETVRPEYVMLTISNNGRCCWSRKTEYSRVGLIDITNGNEITDEIFDQPGSLFFGSVAWVKLGGMYCLIDTAGTQLTQPKYSKVSPFVNGIAIVYLSKYAVGAVNSEGKEIVEPIYTQAAPLFGEGSQFRTTGDLLISWFFHPKRGVVWIDQNGKIVLGDAKKQFAIDEVIPEELWDY
ncbi:MAG: WG repeat-containing protein [Paludibacteraceae bacterium]|nr:WG repeat-containing protein [Paludibacteraceae bacterium]